MRNLRNTLLFSVWLLWPEPVDAQGLLPGEIAGLELKSQGRYRQARKEFVDLLMNLTFDRQDGDVRDAAMAEFHSTMATLLDARVGEDGVTGALQRALASPLGRRNPILADRLQLQLRSLDLAAGRLGPALEKTRALGFLTGWWTVGPFPNERGSGFDRTYEPEREIDLEATYEGSERPVGWRTLPVAAAPDAVVNLDAMVRPNDQVLCYAITCLEAEQSVQAVLHLGSDEAYKVFLNGQEVGGRNVRRTYNPDQDAIVLRLSAGPNLLMIKVCDQEGPFAFAARLRAIDGSPLEDVRENGERAAIERATGASPAEQPAVTPFLGARTIFAEGAANGDPADALRLALMLAVNGPDDPNDRADHRLALQATNAMPELSAARYLLAFTRLRPDDLAEEREENARRHDYETILEKDPDCAEALRSLAELELSSVGAAVRAEQLLRRALEINPDFTAARHLLFACLQAQGLDPLATAELKRAAQNQSLDPLFTPGLLPGVQPSGYPAPVTVRAQLADHLIEAGNLRSAHEILQGILQQAPNAGHLRATAELELRLGERDRAVELLRRAVQLAPFSRAPRFELASLFEAEGDLDQALSEVGDWLAICPDDDEAMVRVSRLHGLAGDLDSQRDALGVAVELNPNLRAERRHLEFLQAEASPFFTEFHIDGDAVLAADPGPPPDSAEANDPYYYLLDQRVVRAFRNGTTSEYRHFVLRVLTVEGANRLRQYAVPHYRGEQRARLLNARVLRADGSVQRPRLRGPALALPALSPGDTVEVEARIDDLGPTFFGDYFGLEHGFIGPQGVPVRRSVLTVILDPGREYRFQSTNGAPQPVLTQLAEGGTLAQYEVRDLDRIGFELRQPSLSERQPLVRITTWRDWNHFTSWWWNLIKDQLDVSPEMRAKVRELTDGLVTDREKIDAIYEFVTTDIRYEAWEFGVHGYKPYNTSVIFERRHGDCKDKSLLLTAMLGEVGIEARPVLIRAEGLRSSDDLSLPLVGHFNHCISYIPASGNRPALYLDGTATYHPSDTLPEMDRGASVLVVEEERGRLTDIPWFDADQNRDAFEYRIALQPSGDAEVELRHSPVGPRGVMARQALGSEPARREEILERNLTRHFGKVEMEQLETSNLLDLSDPVVLQMRYRVSEFATRQGSDLLLKGALQTRPLRDLATAVDRRHAILLGVPDSEHHLIHYQLPDRFQPVDLPAPVELSSPFGTYRLSWTRVGEDVQVERLRSFTVNRVEPEEYSAFREFIGHIDESDQQVLVLRPRGRIR